LAAVPSIGRANRVEGVAPLEADLTRSLYEQHANAIFRYCLHQLGSREEAEDAVQSTFLNAFRGLKRGVVPELESAWLFKIAHNVCLSRRRSSWRRGRVESPADFEVVEEIAPAPSRRADELIGLQDVLEGMPETQRRAILLREWQGLSYREIAEELELSQAAVETLIFRARRALASGLESPPAPRKRRIARAADWGNIVTAIKSLLVGGSAAAKIAATVAVVSATTVVAAEPVQQHRASHHHANVVHAVAPAKSRRPSTAASSTASTSSTAPFGRVVRHPSARAARHAKAMALVSQPSLAPAAPAAGSLEPVPAPQPQQPAPVEPAAAQPPPAQPQAAEPAAAQPTPAQPEPAPADRSSSKEDSKSAKDDAKGKDRFSVVPGQVQVEPTTPPQAGGPKPKPSPVDGSLQPATTPVQTATTPMTPTSLTPTPSTPASAPPAATAAATSTQGPLTVSGTQPTTSDDRDGARDPGRKPS
jgi:RNA polymerase sigma factor (sigma-70 family)